MHIPDAKSQIQAWTDEAVDAIPRAGLTPQNYGIAVHSYVAAQVDLSGDPTLSKEYTLPLIAGGLGSLGSIRPDIVEDVGNGTVCVYDIKTGDAGLSTSRANDFAGRLFRDAPDDSINRILVITVRPSR